MSMPQAFGQRTPLAGGGSDGESAALSYSSNSSSLSMTTLAAPRPLSCGRAWSAFSALGSNSISLPNPRESPAISEDPRGGESLPESIDLQIFLLVPPGFRP